MLRIDPPHSSREKSYYTPPHERVADATFHIDESMSSDEMDKVEKGLLYRTGIKKVVFQQKHMHLVVVYYDSFITTSQSILDFLNSECLFEYQEPYGSVPKMNVQLVGL
jgi:hypothetical protein